MSICHRSGAYTPSLPSEVVQRIFRDLSMVDVCNAALSSRDFWTLTCQLSQFHFKLHNTTSARANVKSFELFLSRRLHKGMKVRCGSSARIPPWLQELSACLIKLEVLTDGSFMEASFTCDVCPGGSADHRYQTC